MSYQAHTLADLQVLLAAKYENNPFWTAAEATLALNEGLRYWNLLTGMWRRSATLQTTAGTYDYALDSNLLYRTRLRWNGKPMQVTSLTGLDRARRRWMTETTASGGDVPARPFLWAPVSLYTIRIWPADMTADNVITTEGVSATPVLAVAGDYVDIGDELLNNLLGYALHVVSFKRGMPAIMATRPLLVAFLKAAAQQNGMITASRMYRKFMGLDTQQQQQPLRIAPPTPVAVPGTVAR